MTNTKTTPTPRLSDARRRGRIPITARLGLLAALTLLAIVAAVPARALDPVNTDKKGLALHGYDPVAYFTDGVPTAGSPDHTFEWMGATWRFANAENRDAFAAAPERYAPQYGGYCAYAVSKGYTADADPAAWKIVDGRLYLNYSPKVQKIWQEDVPGRIASADAHWSKLLAGE